MNVLSDDVATRVEQNLLDAITAYIDAQRADGEQLAPGLTPDMVTVAVMANAIRAVLTLSLMEKGKLR